MTSNFFLSRQNFFFLSGFSFTDTDNSQDSRWREGIIFYSTLPLPPAHEHSDIYLQLCMWDDYHIFLIALLACIYQLLLLDEIYHLIELPFWLADDVTPSFCLFTWWFDYSSIWDGKTRGFELASTITLVLIANLLTKCASHRQNFINLCKYLLKKLIKIDSCILTLYGKSSMKLPRR